MCGMYVRHIDCVCNTTQRAKRAKEQVISEIEYCAEMAWGIEVLYAEYEKSVDDLIKFKLRNDLI